MKRAAAQVLCVLTTLSAFGIAQADEGAYRLEEVVVSGPGDVVCNLHPTDHVNEPDHGKHLWFIESKGNRLGRLDLKTGDIKKFDLPRITPVEYTTDSFSDVLPGNDSNHGPCDLLIHEGKLWFNYQAANSLGYLDLKSPDSMKLVEMPTPKSLPMAFQMGADGNIYVQLTAANKIAKIDPKTLKVTEFAVPEAHSGIVGGAASKKDGVHWFVLMNTNKLLRFEYATGKMETFAIPTANAAPFVIRSYDDGLWFTMFGANAIGHFDPQTKKFTEIALPTPKSAPIGIIMGRDGYLYSDLAGVDKIARIDRKTKAVVAEYDLPTKGTFVDEIKQGPDGAIWAPEYKTGKLARLWLPSFGKDPGFPQKKK